MSQPIAAQSRESGAQAILRHAAVPDDDLKGHLRARVAVIEDEAIYATWFSAALRKDCADCGCAVEIEIAGTLEAAIHLLSVGKIDVVLLDLNLPDSSGLATVATLLARFPLIPVIIMSATRDEDLARQAIRLGAQDFLFKGTETQGSLFRVLSHSIERKLKESEYRRIQESALHEERMAAVGTLASGIAHEYNNIAAVILGNVELALRNQDTTAPLKTRLVSIHQAILRCRDITSGLLDFVRGFHTPGSRMLLEDTLRSAIVMCQSTLDANHVLVIEQIAAKRISVNGNASELGQVFLSLMVNACHAMLDAPRRQLHIELDEDASDPDWAVVRISDTGVGIPPENLDKVFLPFFSTKGEHMVGENSLGRVQGTGLGLAICDTYVRQHGGAITVHSVLDHGTTFEIRLPQARTAPDQANQAKPFGRTPDLKRIEILILDDQADVCEFMSDLVDEANGVAVCVSNGEAGLSKLATMKPALIFLDWEMPDMNGEKFIEALNRDERFDGTPLVIMSGHHREFFADKTVYRGPYRYLLKPFDIDGFYLTILELTRPTGG